MLAPATAGGARQAAQGCSKDAVFAAAVQAGIANAPDQVAGGVCGAFLGPGSQAIAVTRRGQQCDPNLIWTVLRFSGGAWQQVPGPWDDGGRILGVTAVGDDLREEQPIFRASDRGCDPTGGSRARIWHWDGTHLAPGPFARAARADPRPQSFAVFTHDVAASCAMHDDSHRRQVSCAYRGTRPFGVRMRTNGRHRTCRCLNDPGVNDFTRSLASGQRITVGRFRCQVRGFALTCTVTATGKGFRLTDAGTVRRVGSSSRQFKYATHDKFGIVAVSA